MVRAAESTLAEALAGERQYQIPLFQRAYSWGKAEIDQLWDDVVELGRTQREEPGATHFIGSLVVAQSPDSKAVGLSKLLVVDGQQRLTALTLLLAALRDHLLAAGETEQADGIHAKYLVNVHTKDRPTKVLPTRADRESYLAVIKHAATAGGTDRVGEAYNRFRALIATVDDQDDAEDLETIEHAAAYGLAVVVVEAQHGDNAHRIFESLNNRGLQLNQADLLKNYLFMRLGRRADEMYDTVWSALERTLDAGELELLFWLDLVQRDERAKQSETYAGQQRRLDKLPLDQIEAEIRRIAGLGELLATILRPERESDPDIGLHLGRLGAWGTTTAYPVVLQLLQRRAAGTATGAEVARALTCLESFFIRRILIGRATTGINRAMLQAIPAIADAPAVDVALRDHLSRGRKYFATDAQLRDVVRTVPFYWQGRSQQRKLVLQWLEEAFAGLEAKDTGPLTIEHVLPQTLSPAARVEFARSLPDGADVDQEHDRLIHTLGNLTLTAFNPGLSNKPFSAKREAFEASGLRMNHDIAKSDVWGPEQIDARGTLLAERVISLWPGPNEALTGQPSRDGSLLRDIVTSVVAQIPAGRWTSYGELAVAVGSYPQPVANVLANNPIPGAWRVLQTEGTVSPGFSWRNSPGRTDDPRDVLAAEGLRFEEGRASQDQFLAAAELANLAGLEVDPEELAARRATKVPSESPLRAQRLEFFTQVAARCRTDAPHLPKAPKPGRSNWMYVGLGSGRAFLSATTNTEGGFVACEFVIRDDHELFNRISKDRERIEATIGQELRWWPGEDYKSSAVIARRDGDFRDAAQAPELAAWLAATADRFAEVFGAYLT